MIFADVYCLFATSKEERKMITDTTEELRKRGRHWKGDQMELMAWGFEGQVRDVLLKVAELRRVETLQAMGAINDHERS